MHSLPPSGPRLLEGCLWLTETTPGLPRHPAGGAGPRFFEAFQSAAEQILELRREGREPAVQVEPAAEERLEAQLPAYQAELAAAGLPSSAWAAELSRTLFWTLAFIGGFLPPDRELGQEKLADAAVAVARELVASQARQVHRFHEALQLEEWREMAARIAELAGDNHPVALRDIARRFHDQRQARFLPVIEVMLKAGVLERDGEGCYSPGPVALADAGLFGGA